ncbi:MAG: Hsp20/alpha crystallin family protein [Patescibacteria group bacterium]|jgi:HSP20 family protein|nr:Hsp20/alpha crystallin family protein [Patescibacteria group bacterium]
MVKQKKSFLEKITGIKRIDEDDEEVNVQDDSDNDDDYLNQYQEDDEQDEYEYPEKNQNVIYEQETYSVSNSVPPKRKPTPVSQETSSDSRVDSEGQLTIDVYQTEDDIVIKSTIAGVKPEDLDVNINNDMVTIRGERTQSEEIDPEDYYYQECYWGPFSRSVILPVEIISEKAEATMKNGILTLRLPKADVTKTRKIQVRGY